VPVLDADQVARELVEPGMPAFEEIIRTFGAEYRLANGRLDRPALRSRVFDDAVARAALEAILHPRIRAVLEQRAIAATAPYVIIAVPLLVEVGRYAWLDAVIVVDVPRELQRARLLARDHVDEALADRMLDAQATRAERLAIADHVIDNSGTLADLDATVSALHQHLLARLRSASDISPRVP